MHEYGKQLTYLCISCYSEECVSKLIRFLDLCPSVNHVVTSYCDQVNDFSHPTLEYLDIWRKEPCTLPSYASQESGLDISRVMAGAERRLPSIRQVRTIDPDIFDVSLRTRIPIIFPPDSVGDIVMDGWSDDDTDEEWLPPSDVSSYSSDDSESDA
jgi:hypothetical protein